MLFLLIILLYGKLIGVDHGTKNLLYVKGNHIQSFFGTFCLLNYTLQHNYTGILVKFCICT
jgi:hypothetical protein